MTQRHGALWRRRAAFGVVCRAVMCASTSGTLAAALHAQRADTLVVYNAGSLTRPLKVVLDSFAAHTHAVVQEEAAGSLETARKLTELQKIPDVVALADYEVFPQLLVPSQVAWYLQFARNRMTLAYTPKSRFSGELTDRNWWQILQRPGVEVGYSDPNLDPAGYRTLLVYQLAEQFYHVPGLGETLKRATPARNIRSKSADLVALVQTGDLDYAWEYESVAQAAGLKYLRLPPQIDLSSPDQFAFYAKASITVRGATPTDSASFHGEPILYALSIPLRAPHPQVAERFLTFLFSAEGRTLAKSASFDLLERPLLVGNDAPAAVRTIAGAPVRHPSGAAP